MCGIVGIVDYKAVDIKGLMNNLVSTLVHRGPDDQGVEISTQNNITIGFGHTRLSVIDLSTMGHQPMLYKHLSIVFNGEIYNYKEIRNELKSLGHTFISESDTEVILHSIEEWGENCVSKFIGMFAFAIFNRRTFEIILVRDRAGVKPLYYYIKDDLFMFASELKAFHKHPRFVKQIDQSAVSQYMEFGFVPSPNCIFKWCRKLNAGHIITFNIKYKKIKVKKYWDVNNCYEKSKLNISYEDAKIELEKILHSAFDYRMISDVPVGVFLSGGYDSTAVTSILQSRMTDKLKTFTIGFEEGNNEAPFAKNIAAHLGTTHSEYYCTTKEVQQLIWQLPYYYDEPFADSSAIPTTLVSILARKSVKVALSADAGDEIFAGYNKYNNYIANLKLINNVPRILRNTIAKIASIYSKITKNYTSKRKFYVFSKLLRTVEKDIPQSLLKSYYSVGKELEENLFKNNFQTQNNLFDNDFSGFTDNLSIALANDYSLYLQDDILTKVDRATMSTSLEGREPFLDHRIIEFVAQLPNDYKFGETQKRILKDIVHNYVPKKLLNRKKSGFSMPINSWLKNELSFLLEENLKPANIKNLEFFNHKYIETLKNDFTNNLLNEDTIIWKLLQFQMWHQKWM